MIARHRNHYDAEGPKPNKLQLLWWRFPRESWNELREGCSMNFLVPPRSEITPNSDMDEDQICIAEEFVDELVALGILVEVPEGEMVANGPLFCLSKPGQPGQWRILSDMRRGGQNKAIGSDPTVFPKSSTILDQLYAGGCSAAIDASKFFYQFPTLPDERKYLGCIHPRCPHIHYVYGGLPMGGGNSPAMAGRHGAAFFRLVRSIAPEFQGSLKSNTWCQAFSQQSKYDPRLGQGLTLIGADGEPGCLLWAHCDDFFIHGPTTMVKTEAGLRAFLDLAVRVGLLCDPGKLTKPAPVVKYTGLIFDTTTMPCLRIPEYKSTKAIAMIQFAVWNALRISRLALAVLFGILESLVKATPDRIGHTYLRSLQATLHPIDWQGQDLPYFSFTQLSAADLEGLDFWTHLLGTETGQYARTSRSGTLIPSFGDGSGTGTGGTVVYEEGAPMEMWMGAWSPRVYHFSSNWKELRTLMATIERAHQAQTGIRGVTFFYFSDNSTTYFVMASGASTSPGLHDMVRRIKLLEIEMGLTLEVIHVPGTTIITQSTDGLSRGIWASILHDRPSQERILAEIFAPAPYSTDVGQWALNHTGLPPSTPLHYRDWQHQHDPSEIFHMLTFWTLPPEVAAQLLYLFLQLYVECPLTTSFLILVPRVLQKRWSRISRHVLELGVFPRDSIPIAQQSVLTIPLVLLFVPMHTRTLTAPRLDAPAPSALRLQHRQHATQMRGMLQAS
jgi:hypothetical protein